MQRLAAIGLSESPNFEVYRIESRDYSECNVLRYKGRTNNQDYFAKPPSIRASRSPRTRLYGQVA